MTICVTLPVRRPDFPAARTFPALGITCQIFHQRSRLRSTAAFAPALKPCNRCEHWPARIIERSISHTNPEIGAHDSSIEIDRSSLRRRHSTMWTGSRIATALLVSIRLVRPGWAIAEGRGKSPLNRFRTIDAGTSKLFPQFGHGEEVCD